MQVNYLKFLYILYLFVISSEPESVEFLLPVIVKQSVQLIAQKRTDRSRFLPLFIVRRSLHYLLYVLYLVHFVIRIPYGLFREDTITLMVGSNGPRENQNHQSQDVGPFDPTTRIGVSFLLSLHSTSDLVSVTTHHVLTRKLLSLSSILNGT